MIAAAAEAVRNANCEAPRPQLLGVTVLTSLDQATISGELNIQTPLVDEVVHLATLGIEAGLDGVIASPLELPVLRKALPRSAIVITPGVRPVWAAGNDQKRIATPADAVRDGADFLVIGRPITKPPHGIGSPRDAAQRVAREIAGVVEVQK